MNQSERDTDFGVSKYTTHMGVVIISEQGPVHITQDVVYPNQHQWVIRVHTGPGNLGRSSTEDAKCMWEQARWNRC